MAVERAARSGTNFRFLYNLDKTIEEKIATIAREIYGADGIELLPEAREKIDNEIQRLDLRPHITLAFSFYNS